MLRSSAVILVLLAGLAGCTSQQAQPAPKTRSGPLKVTATVGMIGDLARRIGGAHVEVSTLMGAGVDPHLYKASEADISRLAAAEVIFYNGLNLEGKMGDIFVRMARNKPVVPVTEAIDPKLLREPEEMEGHYDPHIWFDVSLWMKVAERIRDTYCEVLPEHKADFEANASKQLQEMQELHAWCKTELATIPKERRVLVTAHDAFGYFGRAYEIEVTAIQGMSTESEASVTKVNELVEFIVKRGVKAVFVESSVPQKNIEALVDGCKHRKHAVTIGGELFSDAMGAEGTPDGTYLGMVKHNVNLMVKALK